MKRPAFLALCGLVLAGVATLGPLVQLAVIDESAFVAASSLPAGSLVYGSDAGAVYVVSNAGAWSRVQGSSTADPFGYSFGPNRYCQLASGTSNPVDLGLTLSFTFGTAAGQAYNIDAGLIGQISRYRLVTSAAANSRAVFNSSDAVWRGNSGNEGGFFVWLRASFESNNGTDFKILGLRDNAVALTCPLTLANNIDTVYVGCEAGSTGNYQVCTNDNVGTATCTDLGASFPCQTVPTILNVTFTAQPNSSSIEYEVTSLITGATASGSLTTDLPRNTVFLAVQGGTCNGADAGTLSVSFMAGCAVLK